MGPVVSRDQFDRVRSYQEIGKSEAKLAIGGGQARGSDLDRGLFIEPTIFYDVDNRAGRRGLDARHLPRHAHGEASARRHRVGQPHATHVRRSAVGGYKQSGIGRELGMWGVEEYLHVKQVDINLNERPIGWY